MPLSPTLYQQLRETLLRCGPFASAGELRALFADPRLRPWRHSLPDAGSPQARAETLLADLHAQGAPALVLLVQVLAERQPGTGCERDLRALADALPEALSPPAGAPPAASPPHTIRRLQDVNRQIESDLALLRGYEEDLQVAGDRRERLRLEREIARQRERLAVYRREVNELRASSQEQSSSTTINTGGGAYVGGGVNTGGGDFVGRDKIVYGGGTAGVGPLGGEATAAAGAAGAGGSQTDPAGATGRRAVDGAAGGGGADGKLAAEAEADPAHRARHPGTGE